MPVFSPRFLDEIRARLTLSEAIGRKIKITRAGREFKGCCPFHKEKTPSFYVNDEKGFYHCFGCGAHGDIIGWTMQYENRSFPEAIESLAGQAGLEIPKTSPQEAQKAKEQKNLYQLMDEAAAYFEEQLRDPANQEAYAYILNRDMDEETLCAFRLGFAPSSRTAMYEYLRAKGYSDQQMIDAGLIRKNKAGKPYSFFRERIMFPVTDKRGRIVAFGGRILPEHLRPPDRHDFTPPKYLNSSDTALFHKGRMLYGASHALYAAREGAPVIVTEGYMDVIACWQAGFRGAVAPLGTALTEEQMVELWRMIPDSPKTPILCFDGDNAGRRAAARAMERALPLLKGGQSLNFMFLPEGEDPDTYLKSHGPAAFKNALQQAMPMVDVLFDMEVQGRHFETPEERAALSQRLEAHVSNIKDRDVHYYYQKALRDKSYAFFRPQYVRPKWSGGKKTGYGKSDPALAVPLSKPNQQGRLLAERILMATLVLHPEIFADVEERLGALELSHRALVRLRNEIFNVLGGEVAGEVVGKEGEEIKLDSEALKSHLISVGLEEDLHYSVNDSVLTHAGYMRDSDEYHELLNHWNTVWAGLEAHAEHYNRSTGISS